jgi:hypothetical protein
LVWLHKRDDPHCSFVYSRTCCERCLDHDGRYASHVSQALKGDTEPSNIFKYERNLLIFEKRIYSQNWYVSHIKKQIIINMSDNSNDKPKKTISPEQLAKMRAAAKAAKEKRDAAEAADPSLKEKRLAEAKAKREAKKAGKKAAGGGSDSAEESSEEEKPKKASKSSGSDEEKPKKASWWATATEEQKEAAKAKAKATRDAKKATDAAKKAFADGDLDDDIEEGTTAEEIKAAAAKARKHKNQ